MTLAKLLLVVGGLFGLSRVVLRPLFSFVTNTGVPELFTATALLVVVATSRLMEALGLSITLGAFLAGVLLADSDSRHELEASLAPFEGLLLGLFFIAVGMSANLELLVRLPWWVVGGALTLTGVKMLVVYGVARGFRLPHHTALKFAAALSQAGECAFLLVGAMHKNELLMPREADLIMLVVTLSMVLTPLVYALASRLTQAAELALLPAHPEQQVVIAGFGRFGQITGRILPALKIPYPTLELDPTKIALRSAVSDEAYAGDATSLALLQAAGVSNTRAIRGGAR
ncbi:MAG: hypothetical protein EXR83_10765 [Gammaproteobacteria bacterium]|nr:hypothetical protein [Gammaproteobacteria bacterium]